MQQRYSADRQNLWVTHDSGYTERFQLCCRCNEYASMADCGGMTPSGKMVCKTCHGRAMGAARTERKEADVEKRVTAATHPMTRAQTATRNFLIAQGQIPIGEQR